MCHLHFIFFLKETSCYTFSVLQVRVVSTIGIIGMRDILGKGIMIVFGGELIIALYMCTQQHDGYLVGRGFALIIVNNKDRIMPFTPLDQFGEFAFQPLVSIKRNVLIVHTVLAVGGDTHHCFELLHVRSRGITPVEHGEGLVGAVCNITKGCGGVMLLIVVVI